MRQLAKFGQSARRTALGTVARSLSLGRQALAYAADLSARAYNYRKHAGVGFSVAIHLCLILLLIDRSQKGFSGAGNNGDVWGNADGTADTILPVRLSFEVEETDQVDDVNEPTQPADKAPQPDTDKTLQTLSEEVAATEAEASDTVTETNQTRVAANQTAAATKSGMGQSGLNSGLNDDLWAAIEPCWRRLANAETLPVTLTVTFGADGKLSAVPIIERLEGTGIGPQFQLSEAQAIQALAECGGYSMAAGQANVRITFPKL